MCGQVISNLFVRGFGLFALVEFFLDMVYLLGRLLCYGQVFASPGHFYGGIGCQMIVKHAAKKNEMNEMA
jgi:hypothetical protein